MGERVVFEKNFKNGGTNRISVDQQLKLVKNVTDGKMDDGEMSEICKILVIELKKFNKGEALYLVDMTKMSMKFFSSKQAEDVKDFGIFAASHCKKIAQIVPSFMLQKTVDAVVADVISNSRHFATEQEAMKWLLEG